MPDEKVLEDEEQYEAAAEGEAPILQNNQPIAAPVQQHKPTPPPGAPTKMQRLRQFIRECVRVFRITKKPNREEFTTIVKISALGILIIGAIGFLISFAKTLVFG